MLTNTDIEKLCDKLNLPLVGVFSKNELNGLQPKIRSEEHTSELQSH